MKDRIEKLTSEIAGIQSTTQADYFHDKIDSMIADTSDHLEMIENSLIILQIDIGVYALRYSGVEVSKETE
jgi:hypothetical protein